MFNRSILITFVLFLLFFASFWITSGCDDSKKGEEDMEAQKWQLILYDFPNLTESCVTAQNSEMKCYQQSFDSDNSLQSIMNADTHYASLYVRAGVDQNSSVIQTLFSLGIESAYSVTVPVPQTDQALCNSERHRCPYTAENICNVIPDSSTLSQLGEKTNDSSNKICIFQCSQEYWDKQYNAGACGNSFSDGYFTLLSQMTEDTAYKECLELCVTRGTVLLF